MKKISSTTPPLFAYVGSYTTPERHGEGNGINVYRVDPRTGAFRHVQHLGGLENPSFLALNASGTRLYSVHGAGWQGGTARRRVKVTLRCSRGEAHLGLAGRQQQGRNDHRDGRQGGERH